MLLQMLEHSSLPSSRYQSARLKADQALRGQSLTYSSAGQAPLP
jgi:hypothetical protein